MDFSSDNIQKHKPLADQIKQKLVTEGTSIKEAESHSAYHANLPNGWTPKQVEELTRYNSKFVTAAHIAVGELATDIFAKDPKAQDVQAQIGYFAKTDAINVDVARERTYQNHLSGDGQTDVVKHLVMKTTVTCQSARGYGLKAVRDAMSGEFAGKFSK